MNLEVLFIDNHLLVVNKPAGLLVQADRTGDPDLLSIGKAYLKDSFNKPGNVFLGLVHRLDRPVSGVMVFARTSKAASRLSDQFRRRTPDKRYLALVEGEVSGQDKLVDYLIKRDRTVEIVDASHPDARMAVLEWRTLACRNRTSLLEINLKTGRPHQIRIQLSHAGFPIVGDKRYGASRELDGRNLALHCYRLEVEHPTQRTRIAWTARPPGSWGKTFQHEIRQLIET